jgi:glycosyltransferase involved in cell wall biosynthesis
MSTEVSILTALHRPQRDHVEEAWESVRAQEGVAWEWVIQADGSTEELDQWLPAELRRDERVRAVANGRAFGVATTRNLGLVRCSGEFVQHLDQDDMLVPGALALGARTLRADEQLAFCFGESLHLHADGVLEPRPSHKRLEPGTIAPGTITNRWLEGAGHRVVPNAIMWRKAYLFAYGGWTALPVWADYGIIFPVADRHPVAVLDEVTLHYRRHPAQASGDPDADALVDAQRPFIPNRLQAMREILGG